MSFFLQPNTIARTLKSAHSPQYAAADHTAIIVMVQFVELPGLEMTFMARADDPEAHGRDIYHRALAGDFGAIAEYVPPAPPEHTGAP